MSLRGRLERLEAAQAVQEMPVMRLVLSDEPPPPDFPPPIPPGTDCRLILVFGGIEYSGAEFKW